MDICKRKRCTGCGACAAVCPRNAITFRPDAHGFLYPVIDEKLCVNCGICQGKCPANQEAAKKESLPLVLAAWTRDRSTRKKSSSGGVFPLLAQEILSRGGVVFGARWTSDFGVEHCAVTDEEGLAQFYGSKYVQSNTLRIYDEVRRYLAEGRLVLFSGTPCQVDALNRYLGKEEPLLFTVDLVCHGVPSKEVFGRHLDEISSSEREKIEKINLRFKKPCWSNSSVLVLMRGGRRYCVPTVADPYYNLFNFNYILRDCCHTCRYTTMERTGDVTLADFWGFAARSFKMRDYERGVSCVLVNTEKGRELIDKIKPRLICEERTAKEALRANRSLGAPFPKPQDADAFWLDYEGGMSIADLNKKYVKKPHRMPRYLWLRQIARRYKWLLKR